MQTPQQKLKAITRLRSAFSPLANQTGDAEQQLHNYLLAVEDWHADIVDEAVTAFIKLEVPGFDGKWVPTAPMLAGACRRVAEKRARAEYLGRIKQPRLPPMTVEHTPEERERIKAMAHQASEALASVKAVEDQAREREIAARWQRTNERFAPDMDEDAMRERLGFTVGDRDGDMDAA